MSLRHRQLHATDGERTFIAILDAGDEVASALTQLAATEGLSGAQVTAIGAFENAVLAYFDWQSKDYLRIPVGEQVEVLALNGDISLGEDDKPMLHLHCVLGRRDGSTVGGHLVEGRVRPTLEAIITEQPRHLRRRYDPRSRLALIDPAQ